MVGNRRKKDATEQQNEDAKETQPTLYGLWMLALTEFREVLGRDGPCESELLCQSPLPLAHNLATLRPICLLLGGELLLVVALRLAGREWL
jgi:hypothetical protein